MQNCGTAELLESTVKKYYDSIDEKSRELDGYFAEEDWDNYCTKVHALKSTSRLIGAMEVSKMAAELEELSDKKLADEVRARHAPLMEKYRAFREKFEVLVQSEEENASDKAEISESDLNEKLSKLSACADSFDIDGLDRIMAELSVFAMPPSFAEKFTKIRTDKNMKDLPVIFLTAKNDKESIMSVVHLKPEDYILKTRSPEEIKQSVMDFFNKRIIVVD